MTNDPTQIARIATHRPPIGGTVPGYPRIGRDRQIKKALEAYWSGALDVAALTAVGGAVRTDALRTMDHAGLDTVPVNTFSWYDQVLDTAVLVGAVPPRYASVAGADTVFGFDAARYFAMARGTADVAPLEMTKWFDTNYHYLVPEIGPGTVFALDPAKPLVELREAQSLGLDARPVVVGPYTFLALAKITDDAPDGFDPLDRLPDLVPVYAELLRELARAGAAWVQLDEPALVLDLDATQVARVRNAYEELAAVADRPALLVQTCFGRPVEALPVLLAAGVDGIGLDLTTDVETTDVRDQPGLADAVVVAGVVDGRNIWRTDLRAALDRVRPWAGLSAELALSTSCSLLHVPYDVELETSLEPTLRLNLAFADQKLAEVVALAQALPDGPAMGTAAAEAFDASDSAGAMRPSIPGLHRADVADRIAAVVPSDRDREPLAARREAQRARLDLPLLPTTTIGSFPQTAQIRAARAAHRAGRLDDTGYLAAMRQEVTDVIALQERLGLDVLVHGEPERNDMVQYFAEQLDGYAATEHGWVQSYGSRCVRPPILFGDLRRPAAMTVSWATFAQGLTPRPVKGMLTGPVTMLAWSFVRDDQPLSTTADQVALALRDEVADLERAGIAVVQVDEPALRETMPLRRAARKEYLDWAVGAFRLATSGVRPDTQIHTHLCYSEFGEIIDSIDGLGADVTSIEAARSRMELLTDVRERGFRGDLGPGVYDIHSPRVPSVEEIDDLLRAALRSMPAERLWVNPDCGLKTRGTAEVTEALTHLVSAATRLREQLAG